jgi:phospholipid/cholesterol/gamma-HCH transport system substrate-binding protein
MQSRTVETLIGACVFVIAFAILGYAYIYNAGESNTGYAVTASFERIDGLNIGNDVRMSGIKVGKVIKQRLDPVTFMATVTMALNPDVKIPEDSSAAVSSESLLGGKYMDITPGGADENLGPGGNIEHTQSAVSLEGLIGKMIFSQDDTKS